MKFIYRSLVLIAFIVIYVCICRIYEKLFSKPNLLELSIQLMLSLKHLLMYPLLMRRLGY